MAKDTRASYTRIGFTVFVGAVAIVLTLVYVGGIRGRGDEFMIETCYDRSVSGLSVGSAVNFRGVKVGEVREIDFIGNKYEAEGADNSRIYILMAIGQNGFGTQNMNEKGSKDLIAALVRKVGLRASVVTSGITGLSRIECDYNFGPDVPEPPQISWEPRHAYIPAKISLLDNFSVAATKVMNQINQMDLGAVASNVQMTVKTIATMTENVNTMVETRQADLERTLDNLSTTFESVKELTSELRRNPSLLVRERIPERLNETR